MKFLFILFGFPMMASAQPIAGNYFLNNVRESAAGFSLRADSTFEYFYSEGALDRYAKGRWKSDGLKVWFSTAERPASDFALKSKSIDPKRKFIVRIVEPNTILQRYVMVTAFSKGVANSLQTNDEGLAVFPEQSIDSIKLQFQFCPERSSTMLINGPENFYQLGFQPWLFELFFLKLEFKIDNNSLVGPNPFNGLEGRYVMENEAGMQ